MSATLTVTPPAGRPARIVVLISGAGSNFAALLEATKDAGYGAEIVAVGADREGCGGLEIAREDGIDTFVASLDSYESRPEWDSALAQQVASYQPDMVVSAGFLKLVGPAFLARFGGRFLNTHNALLPAFPGVRGPADALAYGVKIAGATLFVVDAGIDTGVIIAQCAVPVKEDDTVESLTERIKVAERAQLVEYVGKMCRGGWSIEGRRATVGAAQA